MNSAPSGQHKLAQVLEQLASAAEARGSDDVPRRLQECVALCVPEHAAGVPKAVLADAAQRLQVWREVWPRLGKDAQFRGAMGREARRLAADVARGR